MQIRTMTLYEQAVAVAERYLGPAGERFIRRQITTHLQIKPEALKKTHISHLVRWSSLAFAMITNDADDLADFTENLEALSSLKSN